MRSALAALVLVLLSGCEHKHATPAAPVLVFGVDGLEWAVLRPLLEAGRLPHLRALIDRGAVGYLASYGAGGREPASSKRKTWSPIIWTTIATGKNPYQHGIDGFLDPQGHPYTSNARRGKALWNIADDYGLETYVCGWWVTYPVEAIRGAMVSAATAQAQQSWVWKGSVLPGLHDQFHPPSLEAELAPLQKEIFQDPATRNRLAARVFGDDTATLPNTVQEAVRQCVWSLLADEFYVRAAIELLRQRTADLTLVYVGSTDVVAHRFFGYRDPSLYKYELPGGGHEGLRGALDRTYELFDEYLGQLVAAMPAEARIVLLSDHGMHEAFTEYPNELFTTGEHQDGPPGVVVVAGPGLARQSAEGAKLEQLGTVEDVTPTLLQMLGIPVADDMGGRVLGRLFAAAPTIASVPTHDEGFRPPSRTLVDPAVEDGFKERFGSLGYLGKPSDANQRPGGK